MYRDLRIDNDEPSLPDEMGTVNLFIPWQFMLP
jgi:hypothetical protein